MMMPTDTPAGERDWNALMAGVDWGALDSLVWDDATPSPVTAIAVKKPAWSLEEKKKAAAVLEESRDQLSLTTSLYEERLAEFERMNPDDADPELRKALTEAAETLEGASPLDGPIHDAHAKMRMDGETARAKAFARAQAEARDEYKSERAVELAAAGDARFAAPVKLGDIWDAAPIRPTLVAMDDGQCLVYEGARNVVFGPSESGKTMLAILATIQEVKQGRPVIYFDYENGPYGIKDRLKAYGVTADEVNEFVLYYPMDGGTPPSVPKAQAMAADFRGKGGRLVVMDTTTPGMRSLGLDPLGETDVETFYVLAGDPWALAGCAWLTVDHTPKSEPSKQYGSQQKKSGVTGMSINVVENVKFDRRTAGHSDVYIEKDRHGGGPVARDGAKRHVAELRVIPAAVSETGVGRMCLVPKGAGAGDAPVDDVSIKWARESAQKAKERDLKDRIRTWVHDHDVDGEGVVKTWLSKGNKDLGIDRMPEPGNASRFGEVLAGMLADGEDPLRWTSDGSRIYVDETWEQGRDYSSTTVEGESGSVGVDASAETSGNLA